MPLSSSRRSSFRSKATTSSGRESISRRGGSINSRSQPVNLGTQTSNGRKINIISRSVSDGQGGTIIINKEGKVIRRDASGKITSAQQITSQSEADQINKQIQQAQKENQLRNQNAPFEESQQKFMNIANKPVRVEKEFNIAEDISPVSGFNSLLMNERFGRDSKAEAKKAVFGSEPAPPYREELGITQQSSFPQTLYSVNLPAKRALSDDAQRESIKEVADKKIQEGREQLFTSPSGFSRGLNQMVVGKQQKQAIEEYEREGRLTTLGISSEQQFANKDFLGAAKTQREYAREKATGLVDIGVFGTAGMVQQSFRTNPVGTVAVGAGAALAPPLLLGGAFLTAGAVQTVRDPAGTAAYLGSTRGQAELLGSGLLFGGLSKVGAPARKAIGGRLKTAAAEAIRPEIKVTNLALESSPVYSAGKKKAPKVEVFGAEAAESAKINLGDITLGKSVQSGAYLLDVKRPFGFTKSYLAKVTGKTKTKTVKDTTKAKGFFDVKITDKKGKVVGEGEAATITKILQGDKGSFTVDQIALTNQKGFPEGILVAERFKGKRVSTGKDQFAELSLGEGSFVQTTQTQILGRDVFSVYGTSRFSKPFIPESKSQVKKTTRDVLSSKDVSITEGYLTREGGKAVRKVVESPQGVAESPWLITENYVGSVTRSPGKDIVAKAYKIKTPSAKDIMGKTSSRMKKVLSVNAGGRKGSAGATTETAQQLKVKAQPSAPLEGVVKATATSVFSKSSKVKGVGVGKAAQVAGQKVKAKRAAAQAREFTRAIGGQSIGRFGRVGLATGQFSLSGVRGKQASASALGSQQFFDAVNITRAKQPTKVVTAAATDTASAQDVLLGVRSVTASPRTNSGGGGGFSVPPQIPFVFPGLRGLGGELPGGRKGRKRKGKRRKRTQTLLGSLGGMGIGAGDARKLFTGLERTR